MDVRSAGGLAAALSIAALGLAACGSSSNSGSTSGSSGSGASTGSSSGASTSSAASTSTTEAAGSTAGLTKTWKGTGSLDGGGKSLVVFLPGVLQFNSVWQEGAKAEAAAHNYKISRFFTNAYDQNEENRQVQSWLATGEKPAGVIVYPAVPLAAKNAVRQVARIAPVVQATTGIPPNAPAPYAGTSNDDVGKYESDAYQQLLKELKAKNVKLRSPDGSVLFFNGPEGLKAGEERRDSFLSHLKDAGINIKKVGEEKGEVDRQTGYKSANESLSKYTDKFDIVWALNLTGATGIAQALKQHGRTPGKDVWIISGGDCTGGLGSIQNGDVYSTVAQSPSVEGKIAVRTLIQLIAFGGYTPGTQAADVTPDEPPIANEPPKLQNYTPQAAIVGPKGISSVKFWGEDTSKTCPK